MLVLTPLLKIIKRIEARVAANKYVGTGELNNLLKEEVAALLTENNSTDTISFEIPKLPLQRYWRKNSLCDYGSWCKWRW
jgi:hypothetical protein